MSTDSEATAAWLNESLLGNQEGGGQHDAVPHSNWKDLGRQSDQGILLKVKDDGIAPDAWGKATEVLLYAAVQPDTVSLPTPPASSSPSRSGEAPETLPSGRKAIKVYALPLSSGIIDQATRSRSVVTPPPEDPTVSAPACFLPFQWDQSQAERRAQQKRQSLSSRFDDATQKRRKLKGRGGESIAQAMANIDRPIPQNGLSIETKNESQEPPLKPAGLTKAREGLSRVSSRASAAGLDYTRPASRSGALANGKRSSLHRVESAISPRDSPTFSDSDDSYGNQNRAALSKIVMAGMRLYGLQQRKKKLGGTQSVESSTIKLNEPDTEDEYKLVYHQTFKGALFAFRRQSSAQLIPQEALRDVVDRLLNLFCTNPIESTAFGNHNAPGFGMQGSDAVGSFDLPSNKTSSPTTLKTWNTPRVKK